MARADLIVHPYRMRQALGWQPPMPGRGPLTFEGLRRGAAHVAVRGRKGYVLLAPASERGNVEAGGVDPSDVYYYQPYPTFDSFADDQQMPRDWLGLLERLVDRAIELGVPHDFPLAMYVAADELYGTVVEEPLAVRGVECVDVDTAWVAGQFREAGRRARRLAMPLARALPRGAALGPYLERDDDLTFELLDLLAQRAGADALLLSAPLTLQRVAGRAAREMGRAFAVYRPGSSVVHLLGWPGALPEAPEGARRRRFREPRTALRALAPRGTLGVEERDLTVGEFLRFDLRQRPLIYCGRLLQEWREVLTANELAPFVLAALATEHAVAAALETATRQIERRQRWSEADVAVSARAAFEEYARDHELAGLRWVGALAYAGTRTVYPSAATEYPLGRFSNSFTFCAAGAYQEDDLVLARCDVTRTLPLGEKAQLLEKVLGHALHGVVAPAACAGASGAALHRRALVALEGELPRLRGALALPQLRSLDSAYRQEVGALLGFHEAPGSALGPGSHSQLLDGQVATLRLEWVYRQHCVALGGPHVITREGAVPLSAS